MTNSTKKDSIKKSKLGKRSEEINPTIPQKELTEQIERVCEDLIMAGAYLGHLIDKKDRDDYLDKIRQEATSQLLDIVNQARVEELKFIGKLIKDNEDEILKITGMKRFPEDMYSFKTEIDNRIKELEGDK